MSSRFLNNTQTNASGLSDTNNFYSRVNWLVTESHCASNDDEDIIDYLMCLEQLHYEIEGVITNEDDVKKLEASRLTVKKWVYDPKNQSASLGLKRERVSKYHRLINSYCHEYGLFLAINNEGVTNGR